MNTKNLILSSLIVLALGFSSCDKPINELLKDQIASSISAQIDGVAWKGNVKYSHLIENNSFAVSGTSLGGEVILLTIRGKEEGTYSFDIDTTISTSFQAIYQPTATSPDEDNFIAQSGTVTISSVDATSKRISGTFSCIVRNQNLTTTKTITAGAFNMVYSDETFK